MLMIMGKLWLETVLESILPIPLKTTLNHHHAIYLNQWSEFPRPLLLPGVGPLTALAEIYKRRTSPRSSNKTWAAGIMM